MRNSRRVLQMHREQRREAVRQFAGGHWSDETSIQTVPVNLLALYVQVVGRNLIAKNPRVMLSTFKRDAKPIVEAMQSWANKEIERIRFVDTLKRIVTDALFSIGIAKVCLATPEDAAQVGWGLRAGAPTVSRVDLDDFVFDCHARDFSEVCYIGHRFRVPLQVVQEDKRYNKNRKELTATEKVRFNTEGDERIDALGNTYLGGDYEDYEDFVDLWEVYLPRHRAVVTLSDGQVGAGVGDGPQLLDDEPLLEQSWLGPDTGPYKILSYSTVPGNSMPKGPIQDLVDLHIHLNNLLRKLMRQAERQKEVLPIRSTQTDESGRIVQAIDGEAIRHDGEPPKAVSFGGPNPQNFQLFTALKDLFSWLAGNLDIMGGLSPQSKTATQDRMLNENSARSVSDMQDITITYTAEVLKSLCWYWHHDPQKVMRSSLAIPGMPQISTVISSAPQQRQMVPFEDLEIKVDPYSMQHQTPQMRLAFLQQVVNQISPMMPILQQQGVSFDAQTYLKLLGAYSDTPEVADLFTIQEPPMQSEGPAPSETPSMPQNTQRTYVRENRSERTRQGNDLLLQNALLGVKSGGSSQQTQGSAQ